MSGFLLPDDTDELTMPFWEGCREGELRVQRFKESGELVWPPRPMDPRTRSLEYEWVPMSGRGTVWSFVVPHPPLLPAYAPTNGANAMTVTLDLGKSTQYGDSFSLAALSQDGYTTGRLTGIEVTADGVVNARYTNGTSTALGQVALTNFADPQGLQSLGDNAWAETAESGQPRRGQAGAGEFGAVQGGGLEASNVDLTEQLVNMITAQRTFQANAQMIQTQDQITQTVINIR